MITKILIAQSGGLKMLTKKQQTSSNRLKPKPQKNKDYLSWLHNQEDIVCFSCGKQNGLEAHHVKEFSSDVKDDTKVLMLCGNECHRLGMKLSPHGTPKAWREIYPMNMQLDYANELYRRYNERD